MEGEEDIILGVAVDVGINSLLTFSIMLIMEMPGDTVRKFLLRPVP